MPKLVDGVKVHVSLLPKKTIVTVGTTADLRFTFTLKGQVKDDAAIEKAVRGHEKFANLAVPAAGRDGSSADVTPPLTQAEPRAGRSCLFFQLCTGSLTSGLCATQVNRHRVLMPSYSKTSI